MPSKALQRSYVDWEHGLKVALRYDQSGVAVTLDGEVKRDGTEPAMAYITQEDDSVTTNDPRAVTY